jgi:hypothetical protein
MRPFRGTAPYSRRRCPPRSLLFTPANRSRDIHLCRRAPTLPERRFAWPSLPDSLPPQRRWIPATDSSARRLAVKYDRSVE